MKDAYSQSKTNNNRFLLDRDITGPFFGIDNFGASDLI